jgi:hypothetical protein
MVAPVTHHNGIFAPHVFTRPANGSTLHGSVLVAGGSTAAYAATLTLLKLKLDVVLVQPQAVVGGQFTAQALPASDDGDLLRQGAGAFALDGERFAISRWQREFRERQRALQPVQGRRDANPGGGWVSPFAATPVVAATALNQALVPYLSEDRLRLVPFSDPVEVLQHDPPGQRRQVSGVVFRDRQTGARFTVTAQMVIEATDLGDLLALGKIESRIGQESRHDTGEALLPDTPRPQCQQSITFDVVVERTPVGQGEAVSAPASYGTEPWHNVHEFTGRFWTRSKQGTWQKWDFFSPFGIFRYRRLLRQQRYEKTVSPGDVTVLNWGTSQEPDRPFCCGNDYREGYLVGASPGERQRHMRQARERAQGYLHFLQTHGVADLKPRGDLTWTDDGIALEPYIREAQRGIALTTIRHEDVAATFFPQQARARCFDDTVGIGQYHYLDLHGNDQVGHVTPKGSDVTALPFSLPLTALIPIATDGLILSAKSLGTTHITNAAYRMHPMEWAIGEASGFLAAFAVWTGRSPHAWAQHEAQIRKIQGFMTRNGIPIFWFDDVAHDDPDFEAIQVLAAANIIRSENRQTLHFRPSASVNRAVVATALVKVLALEPITPPRPTFTDVRPGRHWAYPAIETLHGHGWVAGVGGDRFAPDRPITRQQLGFLMQRVAPQHWTTMMADTPRDDLALQRRELSRVLYRLYQHRLGLFPPSEVGTASEAAVG